MNRRTELLATNFIEDVSELDTPRYVGKAVETQYLGAAVFNGKTDDGKYIILSRAGPMQNASSMILTEFRGETPFLTRDGEGLLDFMSLRDFDVYSRLDGEEYRTRKAIWDKAFEEASE
jgi:hypothetical protein